MSEVKTQPALQDISKLRASAYPGLKYEHRLLGERSLIYPPNMLGA